MNGSSLTDFTWKRVPDHQKVFGQKKGFSLLRKKSTEMFGATSLGENNVLVVGHAGPRNKTKAAVWISHDNGENWQRQEIPQTTGKSPGSQTMRAVTSLGENHVVAVGQNTGFPAAWVSTDGGDSWTHALFDKNPATALPPAPSRHALSSGTLRPTTRNQQVARPTPHPLPKTFQNSQSSQTQDDKTSAQSAQLAQPPLPKPQETQRETTQGILQAVVHVAGQRVVAVGHVPISKDGKKNSVGKGGNGQIWVSVNGGKNWRPILEKDTVFSQSAVLWDITHVGGCRMVAVGQHWHHGGVWVSDTCGDSWKPVPLDKKTFSVESTLLGVTCDTSGRVITVGSADRHAAIWVSDDRGDSWNRVKTNHNVIRSHQILFSVTMFDDCQVIAVGQDRNNGAAWTSSNRGSSWKRLKIQQSIFSGEHESMLSVTPLGNQQILTVGSDGPYAAPFAAVWTGVQT